MALPKGRAFTTRSLRGAQTDRLIPNANQVKHQLYNSTTNNKQ